MIGPDPPRQKQLYTPILVDNEAVGQIGVVPLKTVIDSRDVGFLKQQSRALLVFAGILIISAALVAVILARYVSKPLKTLAKAFHLLRVGAFDTRVPVNSGDEIGDLARDFNHLAHTLQQNEQARQRWVAEISHELRTPLAVLRGEVEAVQDGVRPLSPNTLRSLHSEIMCLSKIVDDLYELSLADIGALNYRVVMLNPFDVLERALGGVFRSICPKRACHGKGFSPRYGIAHVRRSRSFVPIVLQPVGKFLPLHRFRRANQGDGPNLG